MNTSIELEEEKDLCCFKLLICFFSKKEKKKVIDMYKFSYLLLSVMCQNFLEKMPFKEWLARDSTCHFYFM